MKKLFLLLSIFSVISVNAQIKETETASSIESVTVFFSGAQVTRTAKLNLNAGTNLIRLSKLSPYIDPNSIQVQGQNKFTIVSVNHRNNYLNETNDSGELLALKNKIELLQNDLAVNKADMTRLDEEIAYITANKTIVGDDKTVTVDDMMDMSELYQNRYKNILVEQLELRKKEKEINKKLNLLQKQYNTQRTNTLRNTTEIIVNISASSKMNAELTFSYVVGNASWEAGYDAKTNDINTPLTMTYKAKVRQVSGEDWKNVHLILSTGNPSKNKNLPQLYTWTISGYDAALAEKQRKQEEESYKKRSGKKAYAEAYSTAAPAPVTLGSDGIAMDSVVSSANYTSMTETSVNTEFDIAIPYTIMSDGKDYSVEIRELTLDAKYRYYAAPKYDMSAFLIGFITGWDNLNLISGMANVYFKDSYIGQSWLNTQTTLDSIPFSLGRDRSVIVTRKKIKDYSKPTITGSNKKVTIGIELEVKNTKSSAILLDLEDQFPVSRNKEIEVELVDGAGAKVVATTGGLFWNLELKPGESKKITFVYSVKFPKDKELDNF